MRTLVVIAGTTVALAVSVQSGAAYGAPGRLDAVLAAARNPAVDAARTASGRGVADPALTGRFGDVRASATVPGVTNHRWFTYEPRPEIRAGGSVGM